MGQASCLLVPPAMTAGTRQFLSVLHHHLRTATHPSERYAVLHVSECHGQRREGKHHAGLGLLAAALLVQINRAGEAGMPAGVGGRCHLNSDGCRQGEAVAWASVGVDPRATLQTRGPHTTSNPAPVSFALPLLRTWRCFTASSVTNTGSRSPAAWREMHAMPGWVGM